MTFTKTPPTKPGAYWWNTTANNRAPGLVELTFRHGILVHRRDGRPANQFGGRWSSRLVPVDEVEKAWDEGWCAWNEGAKWFDSNARKVVEGNL